MVKILYFAQVNIHIGNVLVDINVITYNVANYLRRL